MLDIMFQEERLEMSSSKNARLYSLETQYVKKLMSRGEKHMFYIKKRSSPLGRPDTST